MAVFPKLGDDLVRDLAIGRVLALAHNHAGRAGIVSIRPGKTGIDRPAVGSGRRRQQFVQLGQGLGHRSRLGRSPEIGAVQHVAPADLHGRMNFAVHGPLQQIAGLGRDLVLVDMRIGPIADQDVRQVRHAVGDVGMQVQRRRDGHVRPDLVAQGLQQAALAVIVVFAGHGPVQAQVDAVERPVFLQRRDQDVDDMVVHVLGHPARRHGIGADRMTHRPSMPLPGVQRRADLGPGAAHFLHDLGVAVIFPRLVGRQIGRQDREGIGLVFERGNQDALGHGSITPPTSSGPGSDGAALRCLGSTVPWHERRPGPTRPTRAAP